MVFFSIIIPTYNRAAFIQKAIDSVLTQTYSHWELIIVDDASTDNTKELLEAYKDNRIRLVYNEQNIERSASRNKGIALAKGEYICFLDSDDYFLPNHLNSLYQGIETSSEKKALFYSGVEQHNVLSQTTKKIARFVLRNPVETVIACNIPVITVAIHKDILANLKFDESIKINEDVYMFAQIASVFPLVYVSEVTVVWVLHGNNTSDQEKDYITPQLIAIKKIINDSLIAPFLSSDFVQEKYMDLYTQLVYFHASRGEYVKSMLGFIKGFWVKPLHKNNWVNFLNVVYHLPGGQFLKRIISTAKKQVS